MFSNRCKRCLLPETYPGEYFGNSHLCSFCQGTRQFGVQKDEFIQKQMKNKDKLATQFENEIERVKGKHTYDCLVPLSGGKDSAYLAYQLKNEYDLNILGITIDNGFLGPNAAPNVKAIVEALDIDHVFIHPHQQFFKKIYSYNLKHPKFYQDSNEEIGFLSTVCHACTDAMHSIMVDYAFQYQIPLITLAYAPDQIEYHFFHIGSVYLKDHEWYPRGLKTEDFMERDKKILWDPHRYKLNDSLVVPEIYFPFHVLSYPGSNEIQKILDEEHILKKGKANPLKSNCILNYLLVYLDVKKLGYNPLTPGISYQIRKGFYAKKDWYLFLAGIEFLVKTGLYRNMIMKKQLDHILDVLDITLDELL